MVVKGSTAVEKGNKLGKLLEKMKHKQHCLYKCKRKLMYVTDQNHSNGFPLILKVILLERLTG